jgi:hypothetical protein
MKQKALEQMRACEIAQVSLHVQTDNEAAVRLYKSHGFDILCSIQAYYTLEGSSGDAFWMRKDLKKFTSEQPLIASSVRAGPWPFGLTFEIFFIYVLGMAASITLLFIQFFLF